MDSGRFSIKAMFNNLEYQYTNITAVGTTNIFLGKGRLGRIVINDTGSQGTIVISDSPYTTPGTAGTVVGTIRLINSTVATITYDASISAGLQITTSASPNITVMWTRG